MEFYFKLRHPRYVEYILKYIYNTVTHNFIFYYMILDFNSSYMFQPNCSAVFRLISVQVECTIDNAFNLGDFVLQDLVKIILVCYTKNLKLKFEDGTLYNEY